MTKVLQSYILDSWWSPAPETQGTEVYDSSTGEPLCQVSAEGMDMASVLEHGRTVGQKSLGELSFHERALILKQCAILLQEHRPALYELSAASGATRRDCLNDIDGGIGVLFTYGSKGRRELPNAQVVIDGEIEPLSADGSFIGEHIYTRLPGVALQINAFNFPMWGALEKFAPAFLAGMPTIIKPATTTAYITHAWVKILTDAGLLPAGSLQLVSGGLGDLMERLRLGDLVGFTGSAQTAEKIRAALPHAVRLTCETDSINASVLAPDVAPDSAEFSAYIKQLMSEMTTKAGQKCTAIRRAIVPTERVQDVVDALDSMLTERVLLGDPRAKDVTMGPLVSRQQRDEALKQIGRLLDAGGRLAIGSTGEPETLRADGSLGPSPEGAFLEPMLLRFDAPVPDLVHEIEVFGPVSSIMGYTDLEEAAQLIRAGEGSLVTSVVSTDPEVARELLEKIGPFNGRILFLSSENLKTSTGHGAPVPHLIHGGPGRAGGGEELGGMRAVFHHMQRTALQGSPEFLTRATGIWHRGAEPVTSSRHPFRLSLRDLRVGQQILSQARTVTLEDIETFAHFTGDTFYAHMDEHAAAANPFFPGRVAHGYLLVSWAAGLFVDPEPGPVLANHGLENLRFITPVCPGDSIRVTLTAKQITPRETDDYGEVRWDALINNQNDDVVAQYDVLTLVSKEDRAV